MQGTTGRNVLIVDADDRWAHPLVEEMSKLGLSAVIARSAREAFDLLAKTRFVIVFSELRLVDYSGLDLMRMMKLHSLSTSTVLMSADATASEYKRAIQEGALDILVKPFSREELKDTLRKAFEGASGSKSIIHRLNLVDLLQIMHLGARSVRVKISPGNGSIHMVRGEVVHAEYGALTGADALRLMLSVEPGSIETGPAIEVAETIGTPFQMLLMDLMREIDEARRNEAPAPFPSLVAARIERVPRAPPLPIHVPLPPPPHEAHDRTQDTHAGVESAFNDEQLEQISRFDLKEITLGAGILIALALALLLLGVGIVGKDLSAAPTIDAARKSQ